MVFWHSEDTAVLPSKVIDPNSRQPGESIECIPTQLHFRVGIVSPNDWDFPNSGPDFLRQKKDFRIETPVRKDRGAKEGPSQTSSEQLEATGDVGKVLCHQKIGEKRK